MELVLLWGVFVVVAVVVGASKGRAAEGLAWGVVLGPFGILIVALQRSAEESYICPNCRGRVHAQARVCQHCRCELVRSAPPPASPNP